jgi:hypothetical protein
VRVDEVPVTPEKVLRAMRDGSRRAGPRAFPPIEWPEPARILLPQEGGDGRAEGEGRGRGERTAPGRQP